MTRDEAGRTRHLRMFAVPPFPKKKRDHEVLGETPKAVKPCPEEYEQDSKNANRVW